VPHTFFYVLGDAADLVMIDIIDPAHSQAIGLVLSDRDPLSPIAGALLEAIAGADIEADLRAAHKAT